MPNLIGMNLSVAQESIKNRSLFLGEVKEQESEEKTGTVLIQYPEEGMKVNTADTVRLIVAKKRRQAETPPKKVKRK
jgi:beta-lactam-binding protein with PASTA domain